MLAYAPTPLVNFYHTLVMVVLEVAIAMQAGNIAFMATHLALVKREQQKRIQKWLKGSMTMEELIDLRRAIWFQKYLHLTDEKVSDEKKND